MSIDTTKIIHAPVGGGRYTVTAPIVKEDYGLYLLIEGLELPSTYEVDFSNSEHSGTSVTMIGNADGVLIPSQFISTGKDVFAFLYHVGSDYGRTVYKFRIPNKLRPDRTDEEPTPEEQSTIDQAISALNSAVAQTAQDKADADVSAQNASADADRAEEAKTDAQNFATQAEQARDDAQTYANNASASATASATSASQAEQIKDDVESMVDDAQASASASAQSATASANSASQASASATSASQSATSAQGYASSAQTSAQTASTKASEASTSASTASIKASESAQSASQALTYKNDAEQAKTASQTAQGLAESARDSAISAKEDAEDARDEAQSLVDGISGKVEQIDSNTERIESLEDDRYKPYAVDTASGSIASFSDGADDLPLKSLVVDINPIQDLHGQDSPYPAGGGKNLLPYPFTLSGQTTVSGVTFSDNGDGTITATGTATATAQIDLYTSAYASNIQLESGARYTLSGAPSDGMVGIVIRKSQSEFVSEYWDRYGAHTTFTVPSDDADYRARVITRVMSGTTVSNTVFKPQLEKGSTATAYAPYENICPISGWTEVDVEQSGVNVWDEEWEVGGIDVNTGENITNTVEVRSKNYILINSNATYFFYIGANYDTNVKIRTYDKNKNYIGYGTAFKNQVFSVNSNVCFIRFVMQYQYGKTYNHDISINYPSADHDYHPYTGRSITIDLGQTVYGGKLDVLRGELVIDRTMVDLGTLTWSYQMSPDGIKLPRFASNSIASAINKDIDVQGGLVGETACSALVLSKTVVGSRTVDHAYCALTATGVLYVVDTDYSDVASFTSGMSGVQLLYPLAEPIDIQLDAHTLNSLYGQNNIWADTGDTEVIYRADTKLYIERLTAPEEDDMIADSAITSGQFFMVGNTLYRALANIASGATITVGTNAQRVSLSDALNLVNA